MTTKPDAPERGEAAGISGGTGKADVSERGLRGNVTFFASVPAGVRSAANGARKGWWASALSLLQRLRNSRWLAGAMLLFIVPMFNGCVATLNRAAVGDDLTIVQNVPYGDDPRQQMDVYHQRNAGEGMPVIVFLYGGSWQTGSKDDYAFVASALARRGYVTFVPDYRVYPQTRYPGFIEDAARAVAFARSHAAQYGGDPHRLVLVGHSAGAYLVGMLALDPHWLGTVGMVPSDVLAAVGIAGPYDFLPLQDDTLKRIFAPPVAGGVSEVEGRSVAQLGTAPANTQPISHVGDLPAMQVPPMLLVAGRDDKIVDPGNTDRLATALRAHGNRVTETLYKRSGHRIIIGAFAPMLRFLSPSFDDVMRYIDTITSNKVNK